MIEEQVHIIDQLVAIAREQDVAGVLIAGDVFDRPIPSREALETCERLFLGFCENGIEVFAIPGNHDSPQQLSFCSGLLGSSGLHIAKAFDAQYRSLHGRAGWRACLHSPASLRAVQPTYVWHCQMQLRKSSLMTTRCVRLLPATSSMMLPATSSSPISSSRRRAYSLPRAIPRSRAWAVRITWTLPRSMRTITWRLGICMGPSMSGVRRFVMPEVLSSIRFPKRVTRRARPSSASKAAASKSERACSNPA